MYLHSRIMLIADCSSFVDVEELVLFEVAYGAYLFRSQIIQRYSGGCVGELLPVLFSCCSHVLFGTSRCICCTRWPSVFATSEVVFAHIRLSITRVFFGSSHISSFTDFHLCDSWPTFSNLNQEIVVSLVLSLQNFRRQSIWCCCSRVNRMLPPVIGAQSSRRTFVTM